MGDVRLLAQIGHHKELVNRLARPRLAAEFVLGQQDHAAALAVTFLQKETAFVKARQT